MAKWAERENGDGVIEFNTGMWGVFFGGKQIACVRTNREAWLEYDRKTNEYISKREEMAAWVFKSSRGG